MAGRFITQGRMRRSKWEDSMAKRRLKADFDGKKYAIEHTNCDCGSMECLAVPTILRRRFDHNYDEVPTVELTAGQANKTLNRRKKNGNKKLKREYNPKKDAALQSRSARARPIRTKNNLPIPRPIRLKILGLA